GILVTLISFSIGKGLQREIKDKMFSIQSDIVISSYENIETGISLTPINKSDLLNSILNENLVYSNLFYSIDKPSLLLSNQDFESLVFRGLDKNYDINKFNELFIKKGKALNQINKNEVLISSSLAQRNDINLNQKIRIFFNKNFSQQTPNFKSFKVIGFFKTEFPEFDNNIILGNIEDIKDIYSWGINETGNLNININNKDDIISYQKTLNSSNYLIDNDLRASSVLSKNENIFNWISIFDFNIIIIVSVMIVVAIVNIIIALMVLIFERNKMIGILKSMGANNNLIRKIFLYKGAEIIIKGLLFGNIIFFIIVFIQKKFNIIKLNSDDYYVDTLPFYLDSFYIIGLNALFICVSIFVLWFTFSIISKISPSKIINSK
ncbi:MAG: ABC transporter permease, partial [Pelagibacterales bacterium]|nr:ABC transporter permease [Pelagibacterales bacterium]